MESKTKKLVIIALFIALSFLGAHIQIFGTIALDSLPAFLASLLFGPLYGAVIGFIGHMFTAIINGFPLSVPLHIVIAISMSIAMLGFGYTYKFLKNKLPITANLSITATVGIILNTPVSLGLSIATLWVIAGREAAVGLLALFPFLLMASVINVMLSIALFKALERVLPK